MFFVGSLDIFGVRGDIYEEEVGRWSYEGPTRVGGAPRGWARLPASWPPCSFLDVHSKSSGSRSFRKSRPRRFHSVWTPFDILFLRNPKIGKRQQFLAGPPVNRLVPKII